MDNQKCCRTEILSTWLVLFQPRYIANSRVDVQDKADNAGDPSDLRPLNSSLARELSPQNGETGKIGATDGSHSGARKLGMVLATRQHGGSISLPLNTRMVLLMCAILLSRT